MPEDILLTPEEQDEKAKQWLKDNGLSLVIGIALGLGGILGYNQYKANIQTKAENATLLYSGILQQVTESDTIDISGDVATLKADHSSSVYAAKAVMIKAAQLANTDMQAAITEYKWVSDNAEELGVQHAARIRQIKLHLELKEYETATSLAAKQPYDDFASHYLELLGDISVNQGETNLAYDYYLQASEQLLASDSSYASVLRLKMAPLPKP